MTQNWTIKLVVYDWNNNAHVDKLYSNYYTFLSICILNIIEIVQTKIVNIKELEIE